MTVVLGLTRANKQRDQLVTFGHASVDWVMGRYYVAHYVWPYHETVRMSVCPSVCLSVCHVSYLENGAR